MGIHANSTCVMNYDGATGWLVGEENRGLNAMFVMMNGARLGVAVQGLAQSEAAYQNAAAYAKDRLQGRSLTGAKAPRQTRRFRCSCIPTCAACCWRSAASTRPRAR